MLATSPIDNCSDERKRVAVAVCLLMLLAGLGKQIESIAASSVHVVFNNNYEDEGQRNARSLMAQLRPARQAE